MAEADTLVKLVNFWKKKIENAEFQKRRRLEGGKRQRLLTSEGVAKFVS